MIEEIHGLETRVSAMAKILIAEDDKDVASMIQRKLSFENHVCDIVHTGADALLMFKAASYDLLILDWELPDISGPEVCSEIRGAELSTRILFLTGRSSLADKEVGFSLGADDYLTKPFHIKELSLRVQALLRRPYQLSASTYRCGPLHLDSLAKECFVAELLLDLSVKEFALLELLMSNQNVVFSPESIIARLWKTEAEVTEGAVRTR